MCQRQSLDLPVALQGARHEFWFVLLRIAAYSHKIVEHVVRIVHSCCADQRGKHVEILVKILVSRDPTNPLTLRQGCCQGPP